METRSRGLRRSLLIALALGGLASGKTLAAETPALTELEIKTGFLFNFTRFVEWPDRAYIDATAPIILGIVGESRLGGLLAETAAGKTVNGRTVQVKQFREGQDLRNCQVLFIASPDSRSVTDTLNSLKGSTVLTVGEGSSFTQAGGMIGFVVEKNKVRLEINLEAAAEAHLKISSKVIAVARLVVREAKEKN